MENNNLRRLREAKGLSRPQLAKMAGVTYGSLQSYEQGFRDLGKCSHSSILRIARALGCEPADLFTEDPSL